MVQTAPLELLDTERLVVLVVQEQQEVLEVSDMAEVLLDGITPQEQLVIHMPQGILLFLVEMVG
jgi:hypothetical protein